MISITGLKKNFSHHQVLKSIDIEILSGSVTAIVGPNGSGKTTLLKSILGLVIPESGSISVKGATVKNNELYRKQIGYLPQNHGFPANLKVKESIKLLQDLRTDIQDYDLELYESFGLDEYKNKQIKHLSGGTLQKLSAAIAFMFRPTLLILDEPTSSLDPSASILLKDKIRKVNDAGVTVLLTSHIMPEVDELADEVIFMLEGCVRYKGSVTELKNIHDTSSLEKAVANIITMELSPCLI
ncbi:hypothetical protein MASR2M39_03960 [Ignavibacteriales bacterium]